MSALALLVLAQFPLDVFENPAPWTEVERAGDLVISQRELAGSPYRENRVEASTRYAVADVCDAIYAWGTREGDGPGVSLHKLLGDGEDLRVVYEQISAPVVAKRDFALTVVRERLDEGRCRVRFRTTNDLAPPKPEGFVRMENVWGSWLVEAQPDGSTKLTHTLFSDPAGAIPPFLVHAPQRKSARDSVLRALERVKRFVEGAKR